MLSFWGVVCFLYLFPGRDCYNLDVDHPIIYENPDPTQERSYFGYSLVLYGDRETKWIKIGAPRATYYGHGGFVNHSGVVYHCPLMTNACKIEERFDYSSNDMMNSWIGGAMDISYKYKVVGVSASRLQDTEAKLIPIPGAIFIEHLKSGIIEERYSPLKYPAQTRNKLAYYARSLTGMSLHFLQNQSELLVGAPGVYNFLGTVFRVKDIDRAQKDWTLEVIEPHGAFHDYSGYAVTTGCFFKQGKLDYVTGAPKAYNSETTLLEKVPYGMVAVFTFKSDEKGSYPYQVRSKILNVIYGTQVWEYFGSALAAGDLNGDGLDDLIVGAPFRRNDNTGFNHGSVYVYYGTIRKKFKYDPNNRLDGAESGGRFGTALMVLGDLDRDGIIDLAISAPNSEQSGVIYIYTFDETLKTLKVTQQIRGKDVFPNLRGFGTSFSRATDIDDNDVADVAVGSPMSGHAVILRSKPTVVVYARIRGPTSISKSSSYLSFQCCYAFAKFSNPNLTILRNLTVDSVFNRFSFNHSTYPESTEEKEIHIEVNKEHCERINITKISHQNYNDPITITLTYKIPSAQRGNEKNPIVIKNTNITSDDNFCKSCPVLSKLSKNSETKLVIWDHNCYHQGRKEPCKSKLEVKARFLNLREENTIILGARDLLNLEITIENKGDPAFFPILQMALPNGASIMESASCQNNDANNIVCDAVEVLKEKETYNLQIMVNSVEVDELSFFLNASTITDNLSDGSTLNLTLKVKRDVNFLITGYCKEPSYTYEKAKSTLIQNVFKVEKLGPSPTPPAEVLVSVPYKIKCADGSYVQFAQIRVDRNETALATEYEDNLEEWSSKIVNKFEADSSKELYIDCSMEKVKCAYLKSPIGSLETSQDHADILVDMEFDFQKFEEAMGKGSLEEIDQIIVNVGAHVSATGNFIGNGHRSNSTQLENFVWVYSDLKISLWILVGSAIVGILILICVTIALMKAGFFERKQHEMLLQLKEEALEEEKLIEEMIQKELEAVSPFEGDRDLVFRYITPQELDSHQKHRDEMRLHEVPLVESGSAKE